jgi:hypothetical protein
MDNVLRLQGVCGSAAASGALPHLGKPHRLNRSAKPAIDLILGADDDFIGVAIHGDQAVSFICCIRSSMVTA